MKNWVAIPGCLAALALLGADGDRVRPTRGVEEYLMCICEMESGQTCNKELANCACDRAEKYRVAIAEFQESGLTSEEIVERMVERYGEAMRSGPKPGTFPDRFGRALPWILVGAGIVVIAFVGRRWRKRGRSLAAAIQEATPTPDLDRARVERELEIDDDPTGGRG